MKDKYEYLRQIIKKNSIPGQTRNEFMWALCCVNYFYYDNNIGPKDIKNHWTDGANDGGIDYIYFNDKKSDIYLIQAKSESNLKIDAIKNHIRKMAETVDVFEQGKEVQYNLNSKVIKAFKKGMSTRKKKDIKLVLITNTILTDKLREQIEQWKAIYNDFDVVVYGWDEITSQEANVSSGEKTVEKGFLECGDKNYIEYKSGSNSGIIVSIKAKSLRELYQKELDNGLFGYNLREYIKNNKLEVDDGIAKTIKNERENFWFYNNGVTIACDKYSFRDNKLYLNNFSIINGAQTTTMIGKSPYMENGSDFSIVCKIVKSPNSLDDEFIKTISIASNSQKEIEPRDLHANSKEQIQFQYRFRINQYPLAVNIKRGVNPPNYHELRDWQRVENGFIGQIIYSSYLQKPGSARSNPKSIFTDNEIYNKIFGMKKVNSYNYNALYDIVRLQNYYDNYRRNTISFKESKKASIKNPAKNYDKILKLTNEIGVLKNSGFTIISIILYLIKRKFFDLPIIHSSRDDEWVKFVNKEINTNLSLGIPKREYEKNVKIIFEEILNILYKLYDSELKNPKSKVTNASNYFKSDDVYRMKIISAFDDLFEKDPKNIIFEKLEMFNNV